MVLTYFFVTLFIFYLADNVINSQVPVNTNTSELMRLMLDQDSLTSNVVNGFQEGASSSGTGINYYNLYSYILKS